jgi:hypothetical protein
MIQINLRLLESRSLEYPALRPGRPRGELPSNEGSFVSRADQVERKFA